MNKGLLTSFQLQAGGSHYPLINPRMQETFAKLIVKECIETISSTANVDSTAINKIIESVKDRFQYSDVLDQQK